MILERANAVTNGGQCFPSTATEGWSFPLFGDEEGGYPSVSIRGCTAWSDECYRLLSDFGRNSKRLRKQTKGGVAMRDIFQLGSP